MFLYRVMQMMSFVLWLGIDLNKALVLNQLQVLVVYSHHFTNIWWGYSLFGTKQFCTAFKYLIMNMWHWNVVASQNIRANHGQVCKYRSLNIVWRGGVCLYNLHIHIIWISPRCVWFSDVKKKKVNLKIYIFFQILHLFISS